jgi:hypothetical protein
MKNYSTPAAFICVWSASMESLFRELEAKWEQLCNGQRHVKQWFRTQMGGINRFLGLLRLICLIPRICVLTHDVQNALDPYNSIGICLSMPPSLK